MNHHAVDCFHHVDHLDQLLDQINFRVKDTTFFVYGGHLELMFSVIDGVGEISHD